MSWERLQAGAGLNLYFEFGESGDIERHPLEMPAKGRMVETRAMRGIEAAIKTMSAIKTPL